MISTDILIIGAGPAGTSAALFLAKAGIPSIVVDKAIFPRDKICGDALSGKVVEVLKKLDPAFVDELISLPEHFLGSWGVIFVAPGGESLRLPFKVGDPTSTSPPGFISKRLVFDNWFTGKIRNYDNIILHEATEIRKFEFTGQGYRAYAKSGKEYEARLVIAADGAYSSFARDIGGMKVESAHNCFGLRAYYKNVAGLDDQNFIELHFLRDFLPGYLWIFPLPGGYANIGAGIRADIAGRKKFNLKKEFEKIVSSHPVLAARLANAEQVGDFKLHGLPLGSRKRPLSGEHFMLAGDAAMLIDPFTGEGIGNAMLSGMFAAKCAVKAVNSGNFSNKALAEYENMVYDRLWGELQLSYRMQQLVNFPSLFNFVVNKANNNTLLKETISAMFEDIDLRSRLRDPRFYFRLFFS